MRIGIDLGGTKIEILAMEGDGIERLRRRIPTPTGGYEAILDAVAALAREVETEVAGACTVGIGIPGVLSPATGLVKNSNTACLNGKPLDRDLSRALGREVRMANDANCFALSEATDGAGAGAATVFGVILGTGTGGGIVVDGRILTGPNAVAGEWGHNPLPWPEGPERPGPPCYCGRSGCLETFLSGPGLSRDYRLSGEEERTAEEIAALALAGDALARAALDRHSDRLARGLASVINLLDPDVIVLGGGLSRMEHLAASVQERWGRWVFSDRVDTRLRTAQHGDSSGVRGAARLWPL